MALLGHEVSVLSTNWYSVLDAESLERTSHHPSTILEAYRPFGIAPTLNTFRRISVALRDIDIVHVHCLWQPLNWLVSSLAWRRRIPVLLSPHGMLDEWPMSQKTTLKKVALSLFEKRALDRAKVLMATSEQEAQSINKFTTTRVVVNALGASVPPGMSDIDLQKRQLIEKFPGLIDKTVLIFFGRLDPKKGIDQLLDVFAQLCEERNDLRLLIVGGGDADYLESLENRVDQNDLSRSVVFAGYLDQSLKWGALALADVFVLPSSQENFGIAVVEAMNSGLPVVVSKAVDLWPEIIASEAGIAIDGAQVEDWVSALNSLLTDETKLKLMSENARGLAHQKYSWPASTERLLMTYEDCLDENRPRGST